MKSSLLHQYIAAQLGVALERLALISVHSDTEHLHKFRVSIRKVRSLFKLYMPDAYGYIDVLKEIVQQTNVLRELDVLLIGLDEEQFPELYQAVLKYRNRSFKKILSNKKSVDINAKLNKLLIQLDDVSFPSEERQLLNMGLLHYANSLQHLQAMTSEHSHEHMHNLRIQFKVSRYALEFIQDMQMADVAKSIAECKAYQDHFGAIQDTANQLHWFKTFCHRHTLNGCKKLLKERKRELNQLKKLFDHNAQSIG